MKLTDIKGLGAAAIKRLASVGIDTPLDLVCHFPHRYIDVSKLGRFELFENGDDFAVCGTVISVSQKHPKKGLSFVRAEFVSDGGIKFTATWFNQPYTVKLLKPRAVYVVIGKLKKLRAGYEITAPVLSSVSKARPVIPLYKNTGISKAVFSSAAAEVLKTIKLSGFVPDSLRAKYDLEDVNKAFYAAHFPNTVEEARRARQSLSLENLAAYISLFLAAKQSNNARKPFKYDGDGGRAAINALVSSLDFTLTQGQTEAVKRLIALMDSPQPMNALLEGDVGSGKTIVCFLAVAYAAASGHQSVIMAPTELLARQHYLTAVRLFGATGIEYLTGSQTASARAVSRFNIENGVAKIIIGTHSVLQKDITYKDLTLVITDEQHRFGVGQRGALENKAEAADKLVMSATPIPRTLALTLYGDLELIALRQKPKAKAKVFTRFVGAKIKEMYDYILAKAQAAEQTFIVCPRIEGDEELANAKELYDQLKKGALKDTITLLHGQMKDAEKSAAMDSFVKGEKKVLVSTTIIEVGIDVPQATTMVVYNAERYGLSQLHQLRGRIGRGATDSYCFLIATEEAYTARLKFLETCDDGFELAEKDFELRGAGDFLGFRQHGKSLTFTGEPITIPLLLKAKQMASDINKTNEGALGISENQLLYFKELTLN